MRKIYLKHCLFRCHCTHLCPLVWCNQKQILKEIVLVRGEHALPPATPVIPFASASQGETAPIRSRV